MSHNLKAPVRGALLSPTMRSVLLMKAIAAERDERQAIGDGVTMPDAAARVLIARLPAEEMFETFDALGVHVRDNRTGAPIAFGDLEFATHAADGTPYPANTEDAVDGACDVIFTALGILAAIGVPDEPHMAAVNAANDAKFPGGNVLIDQATGKVTKPADHVPPDHCEVQRRYGTKSLRAWAAASLNAYRMTGDLGSFHGFIPTGDAGPGPVMQPWTHSITSMMQSVLITAVRGPDGLHKEHPAKLVLRWYRRCILMSAFEGRVLSDPHESGGGSFTGPLPDGKTPEECANDYLRCVDEVPHHFHMHLMHAAEIVGYKHPDPSTRTYWRWFYETAVMDAHLYPEPEAEMDKRLGDDPHAWRAREAVVAYEPSDTYADPTKARQRAATDGPGAVLDESGWFSPDPSSPLYPANASGRPGCKTGRCPTARAAETHQDDENAESASYDGPAAAEERDDAHEGTE